jgi:hypothetical protein
MDPASLQKRHRSSTLHDTGRKTPRAQSAEGRTRKTIATAVGSWPRTIYVAHWRKLTAVKTAGVTDHELGRNRALRRKKVPETDRPQSPAAAGAFLLVFISPTSGCETQSARPITRHQADRCKGAIRATFADEAIRRSRSGVIHSGRRREPSGIVYRCVGAVEGGFNAHTHSHLCRDCCRARLWPSGSLLVGSGRTGPERQLEGIR